MRTRKPSISVRQALIAERYRAIVEETENCHLTMREIAALSVSGYTLEEARGKLQSVLNALRHKQKLPREVTLRLVGPGRPSDPVPDSFS